MSRHFDGDLTADLTIVAAAATYTANDQVGAPVEVTDFFKDNGGVVVLESLRLLDLSKQKLALDLFFFDRAPAQTSADQDEFTISSANLANCIGQLRVAATDYVDTKDQAVACVNTKRVWLKGRAGQRNLYVVAVTRGTPTYTASCLKLRLGVSKP